MKYDSRILVLGHRGLVGSALVRALEEAGHEHIFTCAHSVCDLRVQKDVESMFRDKRPEYVFLCAAKVGGIMAHINYPADFLVDNLAIQTNVFQACHQYGVKKLLFPASACAYPKFAPNPIKEEYLLTGELEPSNQGYALAKIAGIQACKAYWKQHGSCFVPCMPTNLYGVGDNYHPDNSHVIPGMIVKFHKAKVKGDTKVTLWGSGKPTREFLYCDDIADAMLFLMFNYNSPELINIGSGTPVPLHELADLIARVVGFMGEIVWDTSKPDGTPFRQLDNSKLFKLGWKPTVDLATGLEAAYGDFLCRHQ